MTANSTIAPATPRNAYIDTLRGVAIFGVACIHFAGSFVTVDAAWSPSFYLGLILGQFFNFAVPAFIFLSGFLAASSKSNAGLGAYYRSRFTKIVVPYLLASLASFYLLNHYVKWLALPTPREKIFWWVERLCYNGVEPTLYFIPLILQLYILQPLLKALPDLIHGLTRRIVGDAIRPGVITLALAILFLGLHLALGHLCFKGTLSYYVWCRPFSGFWLFYFFCGLHFRTLAGYFSRRLLLTTAALCLLIALGAMAWDFSYLTDRSAVGQHFELNNTDYAYARPQLVLYDLAVVALLSTGIALGWAWRPNPVSFLGPYTLDIYLWHILVLYEGAWRYHQVIESCRQMPELIVFICAFACIVITFAKINFSSALGFIRQYRLVVVRQPW